jgi:branched-chain amino acid transport system substrate-binding protein
VDNAANRAFVSAYTSATFDGVPAGALPSTYAMAAYDAAYVLDRAVRQIDGTVTPSSINQALKAPGRFDSPRGPWSFNQPRGPRQRWYLREVRRDGDVLANLTVQQVETLS